jgi:regulatory protein
MHLAVRYLAGRDRATAQVRQFLIRKGASPAQAKQIVARLSELHYLNDRAYAERWVANRLAGRPMGRARLKAELEAKGVADSVAEGTIREVFRGTDEETLARLALKDAQRSGRRLTPVQSARFLRLRGFDEETIGRMIGNRLGDEGCDS